ncbi:hypothetical protein [Jiulongibacter sp. NS-SX5]|uniref:hypothetical protein n=1 Tax=Jiulongibacter sp. NS-SX5 TaxID=3463854 RepID=UPI004058A511
MKGILLLFILSFSLNSYSQEYETEKNIQDYFELLKEEWTCDFVGTNEKIVDIRNGYISFQPVDSEFEPVFQMALFNDLKEEDLIVVHSPGYSCADIFDCAHTDSRLTLFLKYQKGEWLDVGHAVMPEIAIEIFYDDSTNADLVKKYAPHAIAYQLPRYGHTIQLRLEICEGYINYDFPDQPLVSDEQIEKLFTERKTISIEWNKREGVFEFGE